MVILYVFTLLFCLFHHTHSYPVELVTPSELAHLVDDPPVTHKVVFQITSQHTNVEDNNIDTLILGDLTLALFGTVAPKTVQNFVALSNMTYGYGYKDVKFHRIIKDFMMQGGAFDDLGGRSIYGSKFDDETFKLAHDKYGRLSMANAGSNTNGAQFFITTKDDCGWLDGHHVVFGQLINGFDVLDQLNEAATDNGDKPVDQISISNIEIFTLFNTGMVLTDPENPDVATMELVEPTTNFTYLFFFICGGLLLLVLKKAYFKRQHIIDLKDKDFF